MHLGGLQGVGEDNRELDVEVALLEGVALERHALAIDCHAAVRLDHPPRRAPDLHTAQLILTHRMLGYMKSNCDTDIDLPRPPLFGRHISKASWVAHIAGGKGIALVTLKYPYMYVHIGTYT